MGPNDLDATALMSQPRRIWRASDDERREYRMAARSQSITEIAERYAAALFDLAEEKKAVDAVERDLKGLKGIFADSPELDRLVRSPVLSRADQGKAMAALLDKAGADPLTKQFIGVLAENRRLFALDAIVDQFLTDLAERRGEIAAKVISAKPLSREHLQTLTDQLKKSFGAKVSINPSVDPEILGGLVVQVGSKLVDDSVRSKLQRLQLAMKGIG